MKNVILSVVASVVVFSLTSCGQNTIDSSALNANNSLNAGIGLSNSAAPLKDKGLCGNFFSNSGKILKYTVSPNGLTPKSGFINLDTLTPNGHFSATRSWNGMSVPFGGVVTADSLSHEDKAAKVSWEGACLENKIKGLTYSVVKGKKTITGEFVIENENTCAKFFDKKDKVLGFRIISKKKTTAAGSIKLTTLTPSGTHFVATHSRKDNQMVFTGDINMIEQKVVYQNKDVGIIWEGSCSLDKVSGSVYTVVVGKKIKSEQTFEIR